MNRRMTRSAAGIALGLALLWLAPVQADPWSIPWWSIDGGGEMFSSVGAWQLSGTFGQPDASANQELAGGPWTLTGGFWYAVARADPLFSDGFE
jgi:hypothetical protein